MVKFVWNLELNGFIVILVFVVGISIIIWFKRFYKKHYLELTKLTFLFNLIGIEFAPIKDVEKLELMKKNEALTKELEICKIENEALKTEYASKLTLVQKVALFFGIIIIALSIYFSRKKDKKKSIENKPIDKVIDKSKESENINLFDN